MNQQGKTDFQEISIWYIHWTRNGWEEQSSACTGTGGWVLLHTQFVAFNWLTENTAD